MIFIKICALFFPYNNAKNFWEKFSSQSSVKINGILFSFEDVLWSCSLDNFYIFSYSIIFLIYFYNSGKVYTLWIDYFSVSRQKYMWYFSHCRKFLITFASKILHAQHDKFSKVFSIHIFHEVYIYSIK